jgi:sugar transferase (PEP-CTERM system associated)
MLHFLHKYYPVRNVLFFVGEAFLIFLAVNLSYLFFSGWDIYCIDYMPDTLRAALVTLVFLCALYMFDLYDLSINIQPAVYFARIIQAFGFGCILLASIYFLIPQVIITTKIFWTSYLVICGAIFGWRMLYAGILKKRLFAQPVLMLGAGHLATEITHEIEDHQDSGYKIAAFIAANPPVYNPNNAAIFDNITSLLHLASQFSAQRIIVALDDRRGTMPVSDLLQAKLQRIEIEDGITFFEAITGKILVQNVNPAWLIFSDGFRAGRFRLAIKRIFDLLFAGCGLLLSMPITLFIALLIKVESPGPIFYCQERVGERGKPFHVIKFRSMRQDAEKHGAVWAQKNDPRVTRIGAFIRKTRIDEIPQMWNVLRGEMSIVGPRPERPIFVEQLNKKIPYYSLRHSVKPGITGWAQICYPYGASEEDALHKLEYDLYYIKNLSIFLDFLIAFRTIKTVLGRQGAR